MSTNALEVFEITVNHVKWEKVAYLPTEVRNDVEKGLRENGFILVHSPLGSAYVNKENRMHPDYKLSKAFLEDLQEEKDLQETAENTKRDVTAFMGGTKINAVDGADLIQRMCRVVTGFYGPVTPGDDAQKQSFLIQYFTREFEEYTEGTRYEYFRQFCKLADFTVDNWRLNNFSSYHDAWYAEEQRKVKEATISTSIEQAIENGDKGLARRILMANQPGLSYDQAVAMVDNMIKIRDLKAKASGLFKSMAAKNPV